MSSLPDSPLLIRTWFGDDRRWRRLVEYVKIPSDDGFLADLEAVDDPAYEGLGADELRTRRLDMASVLFIADEQTLTHREAPVLAVNTSSFDFGVDASRLVPFRVIPSELWSVENNISLGNMDWWDFLDSLGPDGIHRGF